jgi:hypothetical protein
MPNQIFYYNENCTSGGQLCFDEDQIEAYRNGEGCDISAFNDENDSVEETLKSNILKTIETGMPSVFA